MNKIRIGGTWRNISVPTTRISGTWRPCKQIWVKNNGVWTRTFDLTEPDPFDGTGTLTETPGNVPWQQLSGTWTLGGGVVTASDTSNRIAAVDAGTPNITINIDSNNTSQSGSGVAFWIEDQLNWWGLKTFYNFFSTTTPSNQFYNHFCNAAVETQSLTSPSRISSRIQTYNSPRSILGFNYVLNRDVRRFCCCTNGTVTVNAFTVAENCTSGCSTTDFPTCSKTSCGTQNRKFCPSGNCNSGGNCPANVTTPQTNTINYSCAFFITACPTSFTSPFFYGGNLGANCQELDTYNYSCPTNISCPTCSYTFQYNFSGYYFSEISGNKNCTGPVGNSATIAYTCTPQSVRLPPVTTNVYETRLQLIRSQSGSVNVVNSQSYSNMGNVYASTSGNQITARAYSSTGQSGSLYGPWTYDAGNVPKGNKHGILISAVPYQQTYSISRFKADL